MASSVLGFLKGTRALMAAARATAATPKSSTVAAEAPPLVFEINIRLTVHSNGQVTSLQIPAKKLSNDFDGDSGAAADNRKGIPLKIPATIVASPPQNRKTVAVKSENGEDDVDEEKKEVVENVIKPNPKRLRSSGEEIDKAEKVESPTRRRPGGMQKALRLSPELSDFLGVPEASRNHALRQVWDHIKLHNLQTEEDRMVVVCDDKLKTIFEGKDKIRFHEIPKFMTHHFVKAAG